MRAEFNLIEIFILLEKQEAFSPKYKTLTHSKWPQPGLKSTTLEGNAVITVNAKK
jgi:hypothetical protein